jgi:general secretion pathway protein H
MANPAVKATMRMSAPGSSRSAAALQRRPRAAGFTLIEVMLVMAIIAIATALVSLALRDGTQSRLDEEGARLSALLESARTEARASGITVRWVPADSSATDGAHFRFVGLPPGAALPTRWLAEGVSAEIVGARALLLGPEPVLPAQRVVLRLDDRRVVLSSDGLAPFAAAAETDAP